ncbi:unnamed protein product [Microthlaspi erraticum]|uniref:Uncharacterized protein n=1 Tax=Microthlaspi erraticum TaxID=1685480 RepID=A0A6D2L2E7_9BRAS|nr:unnamed protein product [Microthlaspi erraticum]
MRASPSDGRRKCAPVRQMADENARQSVRWPTVPTARAWKIGKRPTENRIRPVKCVLAEKSCTPVRPMADGSDRLNVETTIKDCRRIIRTECEDTTDFSFLRREKKKDNRRVDHALQSTDGGHHRSHDRNPSHPAVRPMALWVCVGSEWVWGVLCVGGWVFVGGLYGSNV